MDSLPKIGKYWSVAFNAAIDGYMRSSLPIGACIVSDADEVIAVESKASGIRALDHAEYQAIRKINSQELLSRSTIYSTMEPCPMCTGAILLYGIPKVVIGENKTFMGAEEHLRANGVEVIVLNDKECISMMSEFIENYPELWNEDIGV